jgi:hypothetical protein
VKQSQITIAFWLSVTFNSPNRIHFFYSKFLYSFCQAFIPLFYFVAAARRQTFIQIRAVG